MRDFYELKTLVNALAAELRNRNDDTNKNNPLAERQQDANQPNRRFNQPAILMQICMHHRTVCYFTAVQKDGLHYSLVVYNCKACYFGAVQEDGLHFSTVTL